MNSLRKIKIIGFPFAKSRVGIGAVNTPGWLLNQQWFQKLHVKPEAGLSCELVNVKQLKNLEVVENSDGSFSEAPLTSEQMHTVISNCNLLKRHVAQALKDGFYPVILGGDNCQTLGSAGALKQVSPDTKTLWIDSMIDINLEAKKEFNVLEMQTGMSFKSQNLYDREQQFIQKQLKCMSLAKDLIFIGTCQDENNADSIDHVL